MGADESDGGDEDELERMQSSMASKRRRSRDRAASEGQGGRQSDPSATRSWTAARRAEGLTAASSRRRRRRLCPPRPASARLAAMGPASEPAAVPAAGWPQRREG